MFKTFHSVLRQWDTRGEAILDATISVENPALWQALLATGWLEEAESARTVWCPECGDEQADLVFLGTTPAKRACLSCPACGLMTADLERLRRWQFCPSRFLDWFATLLKLRGVLRCIAKDRIWYLGRAVANGTVQHVLLARGMRQRDFSKVLSHVRLPPRPLWLCAGELSADDQLMLNLALVHRLADVLDWQDGTWSVDPTCWQSLSPELAPKRETTRKRGSRTAAIEALQSELSKHLRAARSHAHARLDSQGEVQLLPRPTQKQLARATGLTEVAVCRCLADPRAKQLRLFWDMAQDIEAVLRLPLNTLR